MHGLRVRRTLLGATFCWAALCARAETPSSAWIKAVNADHASAVVIGWRNDAVVTVVGKPQRGTPGSTIKPLLLAYALEHGIVSANTEVYCRRDLRIEGRALPCTHPPDRTIFIAETALAESCNTWFASLGARFTGRQLDDAFEEAHLRHASMQEADLPRRQLATLGLRDVTTTPLELARAYEAMLRKLSSSGTVARGLRESVEVGMAHPAAVPGLAIEGKTGTASNPSEAWTHGWFVGALPGRMIVVIYVPHGDGGTAARLAQLYFRQIQSEDHP